MSAPRPRIGISRCLLGEHVRYDGGARPEPELVRALSAVAELVPLCPEVECGMPIPREPAEIGGTPLSPTFFCLRSGRNLTPRLMAWVVPELAVLAARPLQGIVLKSNSPSCAVVTPKPVFRPDGGSAGVSLGLFARAFRERFPEVPAADEVLLRRAGRLAAFIRAVRDCASQSGSGLHG